MPSIPSGKASIYYEATGEGPALVLAHGAGGNRVIWFQQVPHFATSRRVITFDHRGFGRSSAPGQEQDPRHFVDDLAAILAAEDVSRAALVCQSMGGWTGLPTALRHPERVSCLVLCGTPGGLHLPSVLDAMKQVGERLAAEGVRGNAALAPDYPARNPAMAHLYNQISALNTGLEPALFGRMMATGSTVAPEALEGYAVPTLVIAGEHDLLFPLPVMREVAEAIPGAEFELFPGAGHSAYFEQPDAFNARVGAFLDAHA